MNQELWDKYIRRNEISQTDSGISPNSRINDLQILKQYIDLTNKKILDVGCEVGGIIYTLRTQFSADAIGITLGKITKGKEDVIKQGDMHEMPFPDNSFDVITIMHTLEHSIAPYIVLNEIKRVLKDNGVIYIVMPEEGDIWTTFPQHYSVMTFRQLFNLLHKLGYIPVKNIRKEYVMEWKEPKRDILAMWKNTKQEPHSLLGKYSFPVPFLGHVLQQETFLKYTDIQIEYFYPELKNHFIGRTDSLVKI